MDTLSAPTTAYSPTHLHQHPPTHHTSLLPESPLHVAQRPPHRRSTRPRRTLICLHRNRLTMDHVPLHHRTTPPRSIRGYPAIIRRLPTTPQRRRSRFTTPTTATHSYPPSDTPAALHQQRPTHCNRTTPSNEKAQHALRRVQQIYLAHAETAQTTTGDKHNGHHKFRLGTIPRPQISSHQHRPKGPRRTASRRRRPPTIILILLCPPDHTTTTTLSRR